MLFYRIDHQTGQFFSTLSAFSKDRIEGKAHTFFPAMLGHQRNLFVGIGSKAVECYDYLLTEALQIVDMPV